MKNTNLNIRIPENFRDKIKELAEQEGLSQSDFIIKKCLNLKPVEREEVKEYPQRVKDHKGEIKKYTQKKVIKITEYVPV